MILSANASSILGSFFLTVLFSSAFLLLFYSKLKVDIYLFFLAYLSLSIIWILTLDLRISGENDAVAYHIPKAIYYLENSYTQLDVLYSSFGFSNGSLTQIVIMSIIEACNASDLKSISQTFFFFTLLCQFIQMVVLAVIVPKHLHGKVFTILFFCPFLVNYSFLPQKEVLLQVALVFLVASVIRRSLFLFSLFSLIVVFDRFYMLFFGLLIFLLFARAWQSTLIILFSIFCSSMFLNFFLELFSAFLMFSEYAATTTFGYSFLDRSIWADLLRVFVGPHPLRPLVLGQTNFMTHAYFLCSWAIMLASLRFVFARLSDREGLAILSIFIFVFLVAPYHSTLKYLILGVFGVLVLVWRDKRNDSSAMLEKRV